MAYAQRPMPFQETEAGDLSGCLHSSRLVRSESMDIKNDPRFFSGNVLDKRLSAFGCLSVVSGLMVQNSMTAAFEMNKDMNFVSADGWFQFAGFLLICGVLYGNVLAVYVGVVQPYQTYRLMTAGPTGFETACAYYLNREIMGWRHFSIKLMLMSMPAFIIASGFRFVVKFDRDMSKSPELPEDPNLAARLEGLVSCAAFMLVAFGLFHIHWRHAEIFSNLYDSLAINSGVQSVISAVDSMMTSAQRHMSRFPDV